MFIDVCKWNDINVKSKVYICCVEYDLYVVKIDDCVIFKMGFWYDIGDLVLNCDEYKIVVVGKDYCVWEKCI